MRDNNEWWKPENLKKAEIEFRANSSKCDTGNDFGSYKLINQGSTPEESQLISHNAFGAQTLQALAEDYASILKRRDIYKIDNIADLGCGAGFTTAALKKSFPKADVIGYDISKDAIAFAERNHRHCNFKSGAITTNSDLGKFDFILAQEFYPFTRTESVQEHSEWLEFILSNLAPRGLALITVTQSNAQSINSSYLELRSNFNIKLTRLSVPKVSGKTGYIISRLISISTHKIYPLATRCIYEVRH